MHTIKGFLDQQSPILQFDIGRTYRVTGLRKAYQWLRVRRSLHEHNRSVLRNKRLLLGEVLDGEPSDGAPRYSVKGNHDQSSVAVLKESLKVRHRKTQLCFHHDVAFDFSD